MEQVPLSAEAFTAGVAAATSAFGDATRRDIYLFAHAATGGVTTAEVAQRFGLHPNVARHHLDKLAAGGYVEVVSERPRGGGAGRPSKRYRPTQAALAPALPIRHDVVLINLLKRALALLPRAEAEAMAEDVGSEYGRAMARAMGDVGESQRSFRVALHMVADAMTAHGFDARVDESNRSSAGLGDTERPDGRGELRIVAEHCPFGGSAIEHPVICAVDRGLVKGMLSSLYGETQPATESTVALGSETCVTVVTSASA
jgi:predicted ArsR family transcriptional regulator